MIDCFKCKKIGLFLGALSPDEPQQPDVRRFR